MRRLTACLVIATTVAACGGPEEVSTTVRPSTTSTSVVVTTTSTAPTSTTLAELPPLALYLASIERGLEGTDLEGAAFAEPESLIDTGVLFCELLDGGLSPTDVLRAWVAALSANGNVPTDDDLTLGGLVLGASVRFVCPEYLDELEP